MKVFDYECRSCGNQFEEFVKHPSDTVRCECGSNAVRMPSSPRFMLDGHSGDFPGAHMKWVKEHEQAGATREEP